MQASEYIQRTCYECYSTTVSGQGIESKGMQSKPLGIDFNDGNPGKKTIRYRVQGALKPEFFSSQMYYVALS